MDREELLKKAAEEVIRDKETAIEFLKSAGIMDKDGNLAEPYRPDNQPEHGYIETVYHCGKKHRWEVGDKLSIYIFHTDEEGKIPLGEITNVEYDEEEEDWVYTFDDDNTYTEWRLLEDEAYKSK